MGSAMPRVTEAELQLIRQPLDFYGTNVYSGCKVRAGAGGKPELVNAPTGSPQTHFLWNVTPEALYWSTRFLHERYRLPIVVTENGMSGLDWVAADGRVHDAPRIDFLQRYLHALRRASADGVDVRGYFQWSLMDNFEWAEGYKHRFGLIHVDYETQQRTIKDSGAWYRSVIESNGAVLG